MHMLGMRAGNAYVGNEGWKCICEEWGLEMHM